ncbi:MAG: PorV/PorQ family protein [Chlorobi bacterium]|nr:MAG: membrane protein involved in aromatic hydrocarbon degradation [Chlorobi bacterium OLB7]MBK8910239.1 PorV/PorQ family protein [Chlorobiota bacterium]MBX7217210.1 PorV/PorQ family protein [Candidatus Kapabacteria bacterium]
MKQAYRFCILAALAGGVFASTAVAQDNTGLTPAPEFSKIGAGTGVMLTLPVGARAIGMGGGFTGVSDDPSALYWNPAGITLSQGASATYSFGSLFAGTTHNFAGVTFPLGTNYKGGISANAYSSGDIEETTLFQQEGTGGRYSATDLALGLSFAGQLTDQFSFGVTGKLVNLGIANVSASGLAMDVGTMYKPGLLGLRLGFSVQNLSAPFKYTGSQLTSRGQVDPTTGNQNPDIQLEALEASLPLTFRAGISSDILEGDEMNSLLAALEFNTSSSASEHVSIGAEYVWNNFLAARIGMLLGSPDVYNVSGGVGLKYESGSFLGQIDYGVRPHSTLGLINTITASVRFQ